MVICEACDKQAQEGKKLCKGCEASVESILAFKDRISFCSKRYYMCLKFIKEVAYGKVNARHGKEARRLLFKLGE